jgi:hypothetical protein
MVSPTGRCQLIEWASSPGAIPGSSWRVCGNPDRRGRQAIELRTDLARYRVRVAFPATQARWRPTVAGASPEPELFQPVRPGRVSLLPPAAPATSDPPHAVSEPTSPATGHSLSGSGPQARRRCVRPPAPPTRYRSSWSRVSADLAGQLVAQAWSGEPVRTGKLPVSGLIVQVLQAGLGLELEEHLAGGEGNGRNRFRAKTVKTEVGPLRVAAQRDQVTSPVHVGDERAGYRPSRRPWR